MADMRSVKKPVLLSIPVLYVARSLSHFSMILEIAAAKGAGLHIIKYAGTGLVRAYVSIALLIILAAVFTAFTLITPQIPLFKDPLTGLFGLGN